MYSKIVIEFLTDFEIGSTVGLIYGDESSIFDHEWKWVSSRQNGFEVTAGATATETAVNFKDALELDTQGFSISITGSELTIESTVKGVDFLSQVFKDASGTIYEEGVDYTSTITNHHDGTDVTLVDFALTKSPHYIHIPFYSLTTTAATVKIYIWSGDLSAEPNEETYKLTIPRPSTNFAEFNINIASILNETVDPKPTFGASNQNTLVDVCVNCVRWVKFVASYTDTIAQVEDIEGYLIAVDGYGYYGQGVNPNYPTDGVLSSSEIRKVAREGIIMLPFLNNGVIEEVRIRTIPPSVIDIDYPITPDNDTTKIVQYVQLHPRLFIGAKFLEITFVFGSILDGMSRTFRYEVIDECRYEPKQVMFKNKYGQFDHLTLFKKSTKQIDVDSEKFVNNYAKNGMYSTTAHQHKKINVQGLEKITATSGYISEEENELYKQLLMSDAVFFYEDEELVPINVATKTLEYMTRTNDSLVNYEIDFEYAYNAIQNV